MKSLIDMKEIALNKVHIELGAKMVPFAGYNMPLQYVGLTQEHLAVRNSVGVFDVSHMGEFIIRGTEALDLIQKISTNDASKLEVGKVQYSCMPNGRGGIVDDLLIYKLENNSFVKESEMLMEPISQFEAIAINSKGEIYIADENNSLLGGGNIYYVLSTTK